MYDLNLQNVLNLKKNSEQTEMILLNFLTAKWELLHGELDSLNRIYQNSLLELKMPFCQSADKERTEELKRFLKEVDSQRAIKQRQIHELHFQINRQSRLLGEISQDIKTLEKILNRKNKAKRIGISSQKKLILEEIFPGGLTVKIF